VSVVVVQAAVVVVLVSAHVAWGHELRGRPSLLVRLAAHADERHRLHAQAREVPEMVSLFVVALEAGTNVTGALREMASISGSSFEHDLGRVCVLLENGATVDDALSVLAERCPSLAGFVSMLRVNQRYGASVSMILGQLTADVRSEFEHRSERAARRLGVRLLFPLAGLTLPAFALLTVAPLLVGALLALTSSSR
jgi:Flp pilus assembly protein TadB